jgi:hypothetical protein
MNINFRSNLTRQPFTTEKYNMKIFNLLPRLGLAAALTALTITVANADTINGTATATVIAPLSIVENTAMDFGSIAGGAAAGTVVMDATGGRTATGDAEIIAVSPGTAAIFTITGEALQVFSVSYTDGTLTDTAGGNPMTVDTFTDTADGLLSAATESFTVGATLNVGVNQFADSYSTANPSGASYTITVNYN